MGKSKAQPAKAPPTTELDTATAIPVSMPQATVVTPDAPAAFDPPHATPEPVAPPPAGATDPQFSCGDIQLAMCAQEPAESL